MSNETVSKEFAAFNFQLQPGHADMALAVYITKRLECVIRKYFCHDQARTARIPLGHLIRKYSDFGRKHEDIMFNLICLVQQRNNLVHDIEVNTFDSEGSRKSFVNLSNEMLNILNEKRRLREVEIQRYRHHRPRPPLAVGARAVVQTVESESFVKSASILEIKKPGENSSLYELSDFHCWNMIKLNPTLQKAITEDVDGLFEGLLPMQFEEYLSIVPR